MSEAVVLLIGNDPTVESLLRGVVKQIRDCELFRTSDNFPVLSDVSEFAAVIYSPESADPDAIHRFSDQFQSQYSNIPFLVVTADPSIELRCGLLQRGVVDCLDVTVDAERIGFLLDLLTVRARQKVRAPRADLSSIGHTDRFMFASPGMQVLVKQISHIASLPVTVLLTGETGTGKTHLARILHELDTRRAGPFLTLDCGALTPSLMESEMFGHARARLRELLPTTWASSRLPETVRCFSMMSICCQSICNRNCCA